jgi:two-component system chemotaxis response regulator CheB
MVETALEVMGTTPMVGVLLTGMGDDGAVSMAELRRRGGRTIAESEASAVVFGMPAELIRRGGAEAVLHSEAVAAQLVAWARGAQRKEA